MKKYLYLTAALAIVGAVSCNKEISDNTTPDTPEVKLATLTATIGEPGTKTTLAAPEDAHINGSKTYWCAEDKLSVFDGESNVEYSVKDSEDYEAAEEAVFEGAELADAEAYYALYPYTETATLEDGTIKGAVLPADQTAVAGNIPEGAALAAAYTEDRSEVRFKNVATTIGFTLTEAAEKVEFIAKGGEDIAGTIDITFDGEGLPAYTVHAETGSNTVTLTDLEAGTYYFTILPDVTLSQGYELKIDDVLAKTNANELTLLRSKIYSLSEVVKPIPMAKINVLAKDVFWENVNMVIDDESTAMVKTTIGNYTYFAAEVVANETYDFVFNSGGTTNSYWKIECNDVTVDGDKYYRLSPKGAIEIDPNDESTFGYAIYVFDQKSKNVTPNLYVWDDNNAFYTEYNKTFSTWPGVQFTNESYYKPADGINWKHYYFYDIPKTLFGKKFKCIVNLKYKEKQGNSEYSQTKDIEVNELSSDLYIGYWYNNENEHGFWVDDDPSSPIYQ